MLNYYNIRHGTCELIRQSRRAERKTQETMTNSRATRVVVVEEVDKSKTLEESQTLQVKQPSEPLRCNVAAQEESVARQCHSTDANSWQACDEPRVACLEILRSTW